MHNFRSIILAAGRGTRMKSKLPKVLHPVCAKPIIEYVLEITKVLRSLKTYVVIGHGASLIQEKLKGQVEFVLQPQLLGTADALRQTQKHLKGYQGTLLVLCGDTPLLSKEVVQALLKQHKRAKATATVLTAKVNNPQGYGRIIRNSSNDFVAIREQKDATSQEALINEINVGVYCFESKPLFETLRKVQLNAKKKEFYLTDAIEIFLKQGLRVSSYVSEDENVAFGVNDRQDLAQAQSIIRQRILKQHMLNGVSIVDPQTTYIDWNVTIGEDTVILPGTVIEQDVKIGSDCKIGPYAHIRPGSRIADRVEIGNFAEVSRSNISQDVIMKHFSFLGDATVGAKTNIGAGTITANYDGANKNKTIIGKEAFIGSDSILIAPINIGDKALIGAGSVVTKNTKVPAHAIARGVPAKVYVRER